MQDTEEALIPEASLVLFVPGVKHPYTGSWFKVSSERLLVILEDGPGIRTRYLEITSLVIYRLS